MTKVLMLATFGLEIVECGGALAAHVQAGDEVEAAVLLSRPESRPQVREAAAILGIDQVEFLEFPYGEFEVDVPSKEKIVRLVRRVRPDIVITQDPVHAQHDLDPDRRLAALLYTESFAIAGRVFDIMVMLLFGLIGYPLRKMKFPDAPLILGLILGPMLDENLRRGLILNQGDMAPFFTRPICIILIGLIILTLVNRNRYFKQGVRNLKSALFKPFRRT